MTTIGFVGVGTMGGPMARNLVKGDFQVRVFDIDAARTNALVEAGAQGAGSPKDAATGAEMVITMLPNGPHVQQAVFGRDGIAEGIGRDALYIDMSTIAPAVTDQVGKELRERGISAIDAPVGMGPPQAAEGKLLIMVGGSEADLARAMPALEKMGETIIHCGGYGMGVRMKVVNNYLSTALCAMTAEAVALAEACGFDPQLAVKVMMGTVAGKGHLGVTFPNKVLKGDLTPGFMVDLAHKDLGLALELAAGYNVPLATGAAAHQIYAIARAQGRGRQDQTCLLDTIRSIGGKGKS